MDRAELLQSPHPAEAGHGPLASPEGQVVVVGPIVLPAADLLVVVGAALLQGRAVVAQAAGDD